MDGTVILAPAGYEVDPDVGSDLERPWRLMQGLAARGIRVVAVARTVARREELGELVSLRLLPGKVPQTPFGRVFDRIRLYRYSRAVALRELHDGAVLAVHHFGPCSRQSPSLMPGLPVPFVYGPLPGLTPTQGLKEGDWAYWLRLSNTNGRQRQASFLFSQMVSPAAGVLARRTIRKADAVVVEARVNIPPERPDSIIIPATGLDVRQFSPEIEKPVTGRIVAVGALLRRKGFDTLVRAIAIASRAVPSIHLLIAGEGPARAELTELISQLAMESQVSLLGKVQRKDLPKLYSSAQVMVHPARLDNFPSAPAEAMACGLPVLVSDVGALPEMVGPAGLVHPQSDYLALSEQLIAVISDGPKRQEMAIIARDRAVTLYSSEALCERLLNLYSDLRETRSRRMRPATRLKAGSPFPEER